jgi:hypothetical protein
VYKPDLDQRALAELALRLPDYPMQGFVLAVTHYISIKDHPKPPPKVVRDELDRVADKAIELAGLLASMSDAATDALATREQLHGATGLRARLPNELHSLMGVAEMARRDAELFAVAGRVVSPRTKLVAALAAILTESGQPVTAKANDRLVMAFAIALRAACEIVADPAKSVASALKTISAKQSPV